MANYRLNELLKAISKLRTNYYLLLSVSYSQYEVLYGCDALLCGPFVVVIEL